MLNRHGVDGELRILDGLYSACCRNDIVWQRELLQNTRWIMVNVVPTEF